MNASADRALSAMRRPDAQAAASSPSRLTSTSRTRRRRPWGAFAALCGCAVLTVLGSFWLLGADEEPPATDGASRAVELVRRGDAWARRCQAAEQPLVIDSRKLLAEQRYACEADLVRQCDALLRGPRQQAEQELAALASDLKTLELERRDGLAEIEATLSAAPDQTEPLRARQRELVEMRRRFESFAKRLEELRRRLDTPSAQYDEPLVSELAALRAMDAALAAWRPVESPASALDRAAEWTSSANASLAAAAFSFLARSADPVRQRPAIERLEQNLGDLRSRDKQALDAQAALCSSLAVSARSKAIDAAARALSERPELVGRLDLESLLSVADSSPRLYAPLLAALAQGCATPEQRLRVFRSQAAASDGQWTAGVEQACRGGLLRDQVEAVVAEILITHRSGGYALAQRLLERNPQLSLAALPADRLANWFDDSPELAATVALRFLRDGAEGQRRAVLALGPAAPLPLGADQIDFVCRDVRDPTTLLNVTIASADERFVDLAAALLKRPAEMNCEAIRFDAATPAVLSRDSARQALVALAWRAPGGDAWALRQTLGETFNERFAALDRDCSGMWNTLDEIVAALERGKIVSHPGGGKNLDLQFAARQLAYLKTGFDPAPWGKQGSALANLALLRERMSQVERATPPAARGNLRLLGTYLDDVESVCKLAFDLCHVYGDTIESQLAGARRELRRTPDDHWTFVFFAADRETFDRRRGDIAPLKQRWTADRRALPTPLLTP